MHSELVLESPLPLVPAKAPARGPWLRLLSEVLRLAGPEVEFVHHGERDWASATFSGARHSIALAFDGAQAVAAAEALIAALPDHEFTVPRHLVADAVIASVEHRQSPPHMAVEVELLVIVDA
ncbi:hypothetical protein [Novosphingobium gossypii]|uniref:hypothetical protein n=1 Tax=Novosphingobium gossypii TaxID=1604774 RepID=UPI003D22C4AE